jgi:hypothetical protein
MATNNIKIFDQNKANMLTDEAYNTSTQRLNGVQQGIASSQLQNKTLYQVSLVAYAIGQMMQANGLNASDADAVSTFAGNLSSTIVQKILDKADTTEAKNFTVNDKFITPQTWKVAYDFMKADSDMVTSAVDNTHYITPKLLKEGAEKYGGIIELENSTIAKWRTFNKVLENKAMALTQDYENNLVGYTQRIQYILIDKLKRYFLYFIGYSVSAGIYITSILLYSYNGKELLDKIEDIKSLLISNLSENMLVYVSDNIAHAVDFSTGKFIEKNSFNITGSVQNEYTNYSSYFTTDIYITYYYNNNTTGIILRYNIAENIFTTYNFPDFGTQSPILVIDDDGNAYIITYAGDFAMKIATSKNNFSTVYAGPTGDEIVYTSFQYKSGYIYVLLYDNSSKHKLYKISTSTYAYNYLFALDAEVNYTFYNLLVNDEETALYMNGIKYGTGSMVAEINDNLVYDLRTFVSSGLYAILAYSTSINLTKYKNNIATSNYRIVVDPEYAYFGAPVTEIPEST